MYAFQMPDVKGVRNVRNVIYDIYDMYSALTYIICMYENMGVKRKYSNKLFLGPITGISHLLIFPMYFSEFPLYILR